MKKAHATTALLLALAFGILIGAQIPNQPTCKDFSIDYVIDGDTLVTNDGRTLRLARIDTPEMTPTPEENARKATRLLSDLTNADHLCYENKGKGKYDRTIAEVYTNVSDLMLESGLAERYE